MKSLITFFTLSFLFFSCSEPVDPADVSEDGFPKRVKLKDLEETNFSATLEDSLNSDKNTVYCTTLLYAWDEIKSKLTAIEVDEEFEALKRLHESRSHRHTLKRDEFTTSIEISDKSLIAIAKFAKSLPFEDKFKEFKKGLDWNGKKVNAFGAKGDFEDVEHQIKILYYESDSNFVIKLIPEDHDHEILLFKSPLHYKTMKNALKDVQSKIAMGKKQRSDSEERWRFNLTHKDEVLIPNIGFNIEHNYKTLEGSTFTDRGQGYKVVEAYQRTAFMLNNEGAKIESEARIQVDAMAAAPIEPPKVIPPKIMHFNQPFFLMMKRKDAQNPYFGLWIETDELFD